MIDEFAPLVTPIAGIWFTVFNPCPAGDTDCAQCQWVPNGQKDDPAASPPKPLVPFTKCLATDGKAGYCWFESDVYKCKSEPAECAADGSDINKVNLDKSLTLQLNNFLFLKSLSPISLHYLVIFRIG